jgi:protein-L-isoaspartate(D-aspartate) O-methyltransferase
MADKSLEDGMNRQRERMVAEQLKPRGIHDARVLEAMRTVPREAFVHPQHRRLAYDDAPLPIPGGQTISQPFVVALMCQALQLQPEYRVLEIGTGSGYAAAVLSRIAAEVYTVERVAELARIARQVIARLGYDNIHVMHGDGTLGWAEHSPYDAIVVAAGGPDVPQALLKQLVVGGRLVMPVGREQSTQRLVRVTRAEEDEYVRENFGHVRFVPLIGEQGWEKEDRKWLGLF